MTGRTNTRETRTDRFLRDDFLLFILLWHVIGFRNENRNAGFLDRVGLS